MLNKLKSSNYALFWQISSKWGDLNCECLYTIYTLYITMYDQKTVQKVEEKICQFFQIGKFSIQTEEAPEVELISNKRFYFMVTVGAVCVALGVFFH